LEEENWLHHTCSAETKVETSSQQNLVLVLDLKTKASMHVQCAVQCAEVGVYAHELTLAGPHFLRRRCEDTACAIQSWLF
jgi:hypothetical protein